MTTALRRGVAVYPGTFDPIHLGHMDVIQRGSRLFERLVVGVGINPDKAPFFTLEERVEQIRRVVAPLSNVSVQGFTGLAVSFARECEASAMLRGLRTTSDMETASPVKPRTVTFGRCATTRWICSTRSSSVKNGALSGLMPTPTTSRSKSRLPRWITSMCPRWIGSNVPG